MENITTNNHVLEENSRDDQGVGIGVSRIQMPTSVYYSVQADAFLHENGPNVILTVRVRQAAARTGNGASSPVKRKCFSSCRAEGSSQLPVPVGSVPVGRTLSPRMIRAGCLRVRLISQDLVTGGLSHTQPHFCGRGFTKQFACTYKNGRGSEGNFGKVVIEHLNIAGSATVVMQLNLVRGGEKSTGPPATRGQTASTTVRHTPCSPPRGWTPMDVARRPIHELATSLRLMEGKALCALAVHLGVTSPEVSRVASREPEEGFSRLTAVYVSRGGTQDEIVEAMHEVSQKLGSSAKSHPVNRRKRQAEREEYPQNSSLRPLFKKTPQCQKVTMTKIVLGEDENEDTEDADVTSISETTLDLSPKGIFPLTCSPFLLTPPTTPIKSSSGATGIPDDVIIPPSAKRMRSLFSFEDDDEQMSDLRCDTIKSQEPEIRQLRNALLHALR